VVGQELAELDVDADSIRAVGRDFDLLDEPHNYLHAIVPIVLQVMSVAITAAEDLFRDLSGCIQDLGSIDSQAAALLTSSSCSSWSGLPECSRGSGARARFSHVHLRRH